LGPFGLTRLVSRIALTFKVLQTGFFYHYALAMVLGLISSLAYFRLVESAPSLFLFYDARLLFLFVVAFFFLQKNFSNK